MHQMYQKRIIFQHISDLQKVLEFAFTVTNYHTISVESGQRNCKISKLMEVGFYVERLLFY